MRHLKLSAAIIFSACILFFYGCNNSSGNKTNTSDSKTSASPANTTISDANLTGSHGNFSYTVNGERVEAVNYVQHANLFINEVSNDAANGMANLIYLYININNR